MINLFNDFIDRQNAYSFNNYWDVHAPLEQSWQTLFNYEQWTAWCDPLEKVEPLGRFGRLGKGNQIRSVWKGALPYRVSFDARITDLAPYSYLSFDVTGDLCGNGVCFFMGTGPHTRIRFTWNVSPTRFWMRLGSPFAKSLFSANHDLVMEQAVTGLVRMVEEGK